jgi:hypothetical protein
VRKVGSGGDAVFVKKSAESVSALDEGRRRMHDPQLPGRRIRRLQVECTVWPVPVVVVDEDAEHTFEVASVHDQEPVETLGAGRADKTLRRSRSPSAPALAS